jgi:Ni,Fe-hydrogenase I large subunit
MRDAAYSWCKAPRLDGQTIETGALARQVIDGHPLARALAGGGVLARVAGRLLELARLPGIMEALARDIDTTAPFISHAPMPRDGAGVGLVEAARGALGHWLRVEGGRIAAYQIVAPTTWNFSPRDAAGQPGPLEAALEGAPVGAGETTPIAVQHIVRSFDPCMVCTVH